MLAIAICLDMPDLWHELPHNWIANALSECEGGRLSDRKWLLECGDGFLFDKTARGSFRVPPDFWKKWADLLTHWSRLDDPTA